MFPPFGGDWGSAGYRRYIRHSVISALPEGLRRTFFSCGRIILRQLFLKSTFKKFILLAAFQFLSS